MRNEPVDVDVVLHDLGPYGRYQTLQYVYSLLIMLPVSYPALIYVFIGNTPEFRCKNSITNASEYSNYATNVSTVIESQGCDATYVEAGNVSSTRKGPCLDGYGFEGPPTAVTEWELVCDRESLGQMSTSMVMVGQMLGATIFSVLVDRYGRHGVTCGCFIAMTVCSIGLSVNPYLSLFVILRFLIGAFQQGVQMAQGCFIIELFPTEFRATTTLIGALAWSVCMSTLALFAYLLQNQSWRYLQLLVGLLGFHCIATHWIQHESLRWLVINGRFAEIQTWIRRAARWNRKDPERILQHFHSRERDQLVNGPQQKEPATPDNRRDEKYNILDVFRNKRILVISLILWTAWFTVSLSYYSLYLMSSMLSKDRFLDFFLYAVAEIPSQIVLWYLVRRIGRRRTTTIFVAISGGSLLASALTMKFAAHIQTMSLIFGLIGMSGISGSYSCLFLFTPELYPTNLRSTGLGLSSTAARIGSIISPFASSFAQYVPWGPGAAFGSLCLMITFLFFLLPETKDIELPTVVEDLDRPARHPTP